MEGFEGADFLRFETTIAKVDDFHCGDIGNMIEYAWKKEWQARKRGAMEKREENYEES